MNLMGLFALLSRPPEGTRVMLPACMSHTVTESCIKWLSPLGLHSQSERRLRRENVYSYDRAPRQWVAVSNLVATVLTFVVGSRSNLEPRVTSQAKVTGHNPAFDLVNMCMHPRLNQPVGSVAQGPANAIEIAVRTVLTSCRCFAARCSFTHQRSCPGAGLVSEVKINLSTCGSGRRQRIFHHIE